MATVLKPIITGIVNGTLQISVTSVSAVGVLFDQLLVSSAPTSSGPFTQKTIITLDGSISYIYTDLENTAAVYYRAQYYNSGTFINSTFSELAQETGIFSEYTVPETSATYPPEIALSNSDREIVESIRITLGDLGLIERDFYDSSDSQSVVSCTAHISSDLCTWELVNWKGWPQRVRLNGDEKVSLIDPQVIGYRYLTFSGAACITGTLDVFYNSFRFSDREILLAYDRSINLLVSCGLTEEQVTEEMRIMQAAILLLEGELREAQNSAVMIRDGDTTYDKSRNIMSRTMDLEDLKRKIRDLIECALYQASYNLSPIRVD